MSSVRLKQSLENRMLPTDEELAQMTPAALLKWASEANEVTQRNFERINNHFVDTFYLTRTMCRDCGSKSGLRPKETRFAFTYFCKAHYPNEITESKKQRTLSDIFGEAQ